MESIGHRVTRYALHPGTGFSASWPSALSAKSAVKDFRGILSLLGTLGTVLLKLRSIAVVLFAGARNATDISRQMYALAHAISLSSQLRARKEGDIHLHAHFLGRPLDVLTYARILLGSRVSTSATGHAADARNLVAPRRFQMQVQALHEVVCASKSVARLLEESTQRPASAVVHCGIRPARGEGSRGSDSKLHLLTVARLVEKKGLFDCVSAARILEENGVDFIWRIIGDGPLRSALELDSRPLVSTGAIEWLGAQPSSTVHQNLNKWADVFVLPSKVSSNGDVDGIPVALMEAMTHGVAVISSNLSGIPELVSHEKTGLLIDPGNVEELCSAIARMKDDAFRSIMSHHAKLFVDLEFNQVREAQKLSSLITKI
ncbi:GDP-mannose-dependent alpha-(1-6)-phosphatidylinositol monomannoside mannosyltransferase [Arthrobacter sp. Bi83]|nr:GDP-mannose-dependent alpha-(1-6)-phosphatidylinositol monomannoside mannosyltransferase [Arthrobacter sp. Bi83]